MDFLPWGGGGHELDGLLPAAGNPHLAHAFNQRHFPWHVFDDGLGNHAMAGVWHRTGRHCDNYFQQYMPGAIGDYSAF